MISLIIVFYNYFVWLFTGVVPIERIVQETSAFIVLFFTLIEFLIEISLICFIIEVLVHIGFGKKDN